MIDKTLPDGSIVKAFPISIPQQFMFFMSAQYGAKYPVNNIGLAYYIHGKIDTGAMKEAISEAVVRCDTMRLRFTPDEKYKILQYVTEKSELIIEEWDMSDIPLEEAKKRLLNISRKEIPTYNCEIHKTALVSLENGINCLFFRLHHFAFDAYSAKVFLNDVIAIYLNKTQGMAYPKPMHPYIPVLLKELAYINSAEKEADKDYWYHSLADTDEPIFTDYLIESRLKEQRKTHPEHRFADIHSGSPEAGTLIFSMSAENSEKIIKACEDNSLSVCAFLSMGVRTALSIFNDNEKDVSFKMIVNRRGSIAEKKSGGIRINFFPMRSIVPDDMTYMDAVRNISDIQSEIYSHCSLSFMEMLIERHKSMPADAKPDSTYDSVGFSYQPYIESVLIPGVICDSEWLNNGASMIPLYLTVRHRTSDKGMDFIFEYRKNPDPAYDLTVFYKKLEAALLAGAEDVNIKAGEILKANEITTEEREGKNNG